jgi:hypothetical protein
MAAAMIKKRGEKSKRAIALPARSKTIFFIRREVLLLKPLGTGNK